MMTNERPTWEEATQAILEKEKASLTILQNEIDQKTTELEKKKNYIDALEKVLELHRQVGIINTSSNFGMEIEKLLKQSIWQSMVDIASTNNGMLVVKEAVTTLLNARVFTDREHARNAIYSNVWQHRKDLEKQSPGVYKLKNISNVELKLPV